MRDREQIMSDAYSTLLQQKCHSLPIFPERFVLPFVVISYQSYAHLTGIPAEWFLEDHALYEGCSLCDAEQNWIVLYNESTSPARQRFTIAHELGHLILNHAQRGRLQEEEADLFASVLLVPDALLSAFQRRGIALNESFITQHFQVSLSMARQKLRTFQVANVAHTLDDQIETLFYPILKKIAPMMKTENHVPDTFLDPLE